MFSNVSLADNIKHSQINHQKLSDLISRVEENPLIFDKSNLQYKNHRARSKVFQSIAEDLGVDRKYPKIKIYSTNKNKKKYIKLNFLIKIGKTFFM